MKFGLIGYPISHSKSPELFRASFANSGKDTYDLIEEKDFEKAYSIFLREYDAVNVTAPFKESAYNKADKADTITMQIKACNLLQKKDGIIFARNTDFWGVQNLLRLYLPPVEKPEVLVFGCGGAGKAAALAALNLNLKVTVANRNIEKASKFSIDTESAVSVLSLEDATNIISDKYSNRKRFGVIIYTIPVAIDRISDADMEGRILIEANYLNPVFVYDGNICNSEHEHTPNANRSGVPSTHITGIQWLKAQAEISFAVMMGTSR